MAITSERTEEALTVLLSDKLHALQTVARRCCLPVAMVERSVEKVALGHEAHHDDAAIIDLLAELRDELCDCAGYGALLHAQGRWSVRLFAVVWLSGLAWRMMGADRRTVAIGDAVEIPS